MSRNLVEIVRSRHEVGAPTALEVLEEAIRDEPAGVAAARSGLPDGRGARRVDVSSLLAHCGEELGLA